MIETASTRSESPHRRHGPHPARHKSSAVAPARPRHCEFDALRATAIILVVTLHAGLAYTQLDIPRLLWGVREPSTHLGFDLFSWWSMGVSVPLFFMIGGFFAAEIYESRGPSGFVKTRVRRIVVPFLVSSATILPLCFFAWAYGWIVTGRCDFSEIRRMRFADVAIEPDLYGPAHLWFLEYLIVMLAAFFVVRHFWRGRGIPAKDGDWIFAPWMPFALAVPTTLLLAIGRGRYGIDVTFDRHNSFVPDPLRLIHYGSFFAFGVGVHRSRATLKRLTGWGHWCLLAVVPIYACRAALLRLDLVKPLDAPGAFALCLLGGLFAWLTVFGVLGLYHRLFHQPSRVVRYVAESSYWIYLIHMPIVGVVQADLFGLRWPTFAKFAVTWVITFAIGIATYEVLVRRRSKPSLTKSDSRIEAGVTSQLALETA